MLDIFSIMTLAMMIDRFSLVTLGLVLVPVLLVLGLVALIVMLTRGRSERVVTERSSAPAADPPPSLDQRKAGLERSRCRYQEERSRILGMLEKGTVTPEEADRLFTTLDRETSTMACPYCGGDVRIEAIRCKHCRRDLLAGIDKPRRICKSRDKMLAGVCGGLAQYAGLDATMMRLLVALVVLFTSIIPGLLIYLVAAMVMPESE